MCLGTHTVRPEHVIYFRILMSLWSALLKRNTLLGLWALSHTHARTHTHTPTHTQTHSHTPSHAHKCIYMYLYTRLHPYIPGSTHSHINIVGSPRLTAERGSFMHTHSRTPGRLIYFNYRQIHRDPITKIEGYLFFSVHPKRLIKFSCKDEIIWYYTNVFFIFIIAM